MKIKIKDKMVFSKLESELGCKYNMMEGGYVSPDGATIVIDNRQPYINEVMQFTRNKEGHDKNVNELNNLGYLEV